MTDNPNTKRTTVYLPFKLHEDFIKKHGERQLSGFVKEMIEYDLMGDKPEIIDREIEKIQNTSESKVKYLLSQRKIAEKKQQKKAIRLGAANGVEVWDYRTTTPPTAPKASPKASAKKGGDK